AAANGTPQWSINRNYAEMIAKAGGIPILAINDDVIAEYAEIADGLLLSGGKDIATNLYGQEQKFDNIFVDEARDIQEWKLLDAFVPTKKPIFGICRGVQVMNAYFGGTLIQDIPGQLGGDHSKGVNHEIEIKKDSILGQLFGESMLINSYHHQGLENIADGFIATAWADAGGNKLVEAIEHESLPYWSVQWHPERMSGPVTNPVDCKDSFPIFEYFVNQCKK
ncbi:MAG: gamma-glutamyl-gamma-aminobutyrate hydrolase family protein, partial [Lachnospiraceae bacterium]|nr:gamma-glutamyl-gamma-aminobutyrate hydrolase family protein [Lachnospiraceae bacterium]